MNGIGEAIKKRRNDLKINQQTLADLAGVGINTLVSIERGTGNPSFTTLQSVLEVLGMELKCQMKKL